MIASVIDLSMAPPVYWMTVGMVLDTDYGGFMSRCYGIRITGRAVVIDEDSNITGLYQGEQPVEAVLDMLDTSWEAPVSVRDDSHKKLPVAD